MIKNNCSIEVVHSARKGLSSMSQVSADTITATLAKHFTDVRTSIINDVLDLENLVSRQPDLVFLGMECVPDKPDNINNRKIWLSDYLEKNNIAYTGSNRLALELGRNKPLAKQRVKDSGLETSAFRVIKPGQTYCQNDIPLSYPMFVKPINKGGGLGIDSSSVVYDFGQLQSKVQMITSEFQVDSLIEEYLPGREFSVAILRNDRSLELQAMPIELVAPLDDHHTRLLSKRVKSANIEHALKITDITLKEKVSDFALNIFRTLGARDYGRIDIRLDATDVPQFLEANLIPSLIGGYGSFPKACLLNTGLEYEPMIIKIAKLGLNRNQNIEYIS